MGFDQGTIQALGVLDNILGRQAANTQRDKDRAGRLLELKIRSDEREIDRLTARLTNLQNQNSNLAQEFTKLTGVSAKMDKIQNDPNYAGSGRGKAAVEKQRSVIAMDRQGIQSQITAALDERETLMGRVGAFYNAYGTIAPKAFEKYVQTGADQTLTGISTIGPDELDAIKEDLATQGIAMTPEVEAGMLKAFKDLGDNRFNQEFKEAQLNMQQALMRMRLSAKKKSGKDEVPGLKDGLTELRQKIIRANEQAKGSEIEDMVGIALPLTADTTVGQIAVSAAVEGAEMLLKGGRLDKSGPAFGLFKDTPDDVLDLFSTFKGATGQARDDAAVAIFRKLSAMGSDAVTGAFDFTGLGRDRELASGEPQFIGRLIDIFDTANRIEADIMLHDPNARAVAGLVNTVSPEGTPEGESEDSDEGFFDFMFNAVSNIGKDAGLRREQVTDLKSGKSETAVGKARADRRANLQEFKQEVLQPFGEFLQDPPPLSPGALIFEGVKALEDTGIGDDIPPVTPGMLLMEMINPTPPSREEEARERERKLIEEEKLLQSVRGR